jgi:hypothetical protein
MMAIMRVVVTKNTNNVMGIERGLNEPIVMGNQPWQEYWQGK